MTAAGVASDIDLALALVANDHGLGIAADCAGGIALGKGIGRDPTCRSTTYVLAPANSPLARVQAHVRRHLHQALTVDSLARVANTSSRTLARLFTRELGVTPHRFVEELRLEHARELLHLTDVPLKVLAHRCGFGGPEQMRAVFKRRLGISPAAYRGRRVFDRPA